MVGIIIVHPGGKHSFTKAQSRARQAIDYLVNERSVNPEHIGAVILKKKRREFGAELQLCPFFRPDELRSIFKGEVVIIGIEIKKKAH